MQRQLADGEFDISYLKLTEHAQFESVSYEQQHLTNAIDHAVIAVIFGQYKIAGKANKAMTSIAAAAFRRQKYFAEKARTREIQPWDLAAEYIARIDVMERDSSHMVI